MRIKFFLFLIAALSAVENISSQQASQTYRTINGDLAITIKQGDSAILMFSNHLLVLLDMETSRVSFRVGYETLQTRIDSIDSQLKVLRGINLEFAGKIGITINTRNFAPQRYNMEGAITSTEPPTIVKGNGSMNCLPTGGGRTPACTLLLSFETTLAALHLRDIFKTADEVVRIDIRQSVLEREEDKD